ncbi:MAG: TadE/TadG family type IV pilus assembly protein [Dehalococcoidia bacterium]
MPRLLRILSRDEGQALVETVLLFPFLLVLVLVLVEFGFAFNAFITVNSASAEAARYAAVGGPLDDGLCSSVANPPSVEGVAVRASGDAIECADVDVTYMKFMPGAQYVRGDAVTVRVTRTYATVTPLGDLFSAFSFGSFPAEMTLSACSEARLERGPVDQSGLVTGTSC